MSGAGVPGGELLLEQQKLILKASGISEDIINQNLQLQLKINKTLSEGKDLNDIRKDIQDFAEKDFETLSKEIKASIQDKKTYINSTVQSQIQMFNNIWFRYFVQYNPSAVLRNVKVPVLLLFGDLDLQVPVSQNRTIMEEALKYGGNNKFSTIVFPKANHLYQEATTGSPAEYSQLKKEFIPGFLETIAGWIARTIR
jgi:pimeloyl-ACP methyl ester carboxylesterase